MISPIALDCPPLSEARLHGDVDWVHEAITIKAASVLLYGENLRDTLVMPPFDDYVRNVTSAPLLFFADVHREASFLTFPLTYPDPEGEFYGYCANSSREDTRDGTKMLVHIVGFAATCLIALHAGRIVKKKSDWLPMYKAYVNDTWTALLEAIYNRCKGEWGYRIPESSDERQVVRELCRQTLAFENYYLRHYRAYLLGELRGEDRERRLTAVRRLQHIVYPDSEILAALKAIAPDDEEFRTTIGETLRVYAAKTVVKL
jgi:hypothetical protein